MKAKLYSQYGSALERQNSASSRATETPGGFSFAPMRNTFSDQIKFTGALTGRALR